MSWMPIEWQRGASSSEPTIEPGLRIVATVLRIAFITLLLIVTIHVSMPQSETIWTAYDTPSDLIRMALGLAVCAWIAVQLFAAPEDADGHRTWLYLGLLAVPFVSICIIAIW